MKRRTGPIPLWAMVGALLLVLSPSFAAAAGSPVRLLQPADPAALRAASRGATLLTLEAGPEGIRLREVVVVRDLPPGLPKLRAGEEVLPGYVVAALGPDGRVLMVGQFELDWVLHGDDLDEETGELRCISKVLDRVVFVLKLPLVPEAQELVFLEVLAHASADPSALGLDLAAGRRPAGTRSLGRVDLVSALTIPEVVRGD